MVFAAEEKCYPRRMHNGKTVNLCLEQCKMGIISQGYYIRVEGGMSVPVYCRIIPDLYRSLYSPSHPKWCNTAIHGTKIEHCASIVDTGLICGGVQRQSEDKRAEVHLVNTIVSGSHKTAGVRKGSDAYVQLDMLQLYKDGIKP